MEIAENNRKLLQFLVISSEKFLQRLDLAALLLHQRPDAGGARTNGLELRIQRFRIHRKQDGRLLVHERGQRVDLLLLRHRIVQTLDRRIAVLGFPYLLRLKRRPLKKLATDRLKPLRADVQVHHLLVLDLERNEKVEQPNESGHIRGARNDRDAEEVVQHLNHVLDVRAWVGFHVALVLELGRNRGVGR